MRILKWMASGTAICLLICLFVLDAPRTAGVTLSLRIQGRSFPAATVRRTVRIQIWKLLAGDGTEAQLQAELNQIQLRDGRDFGLEPWRLPMPDLFSCADLPAADLYIPFSNFEDPHRVQISQPQTVCFVMETSVTPTLSVSPVALLHEIGIMPRETMNDIASKVIFPNDADATQSFTTGPAPIGRKRLFEWTTTFASGQSLRIFNDLFYRGVGDSGLAYQAIYPELKAAEVRAALARSLFEAVRK